MQAVPEIKKIIHPPVVAVRVCGEGRGGFGARKRKRERERERRERWKE